MKQVYQIHEVIEHCHVDKEFVVTCLRHHWIIPFDSAQSLFDDADLARILLIHDLVETFEVNPEGISLILHLLDQLQVARKSIDRINRTEGRIGR